jgi:hypothetical protein
MTDNSKATEKAIAEPQEKAPVFLNRDQILHARDEQLEVVDVPEWGGRVRVRGMSGSQRDAFEESVFARDSSGDREFDGHDFKAKFVSRVIVDEHGTRMFTSEDVGKLSQRSARALQRVFNVGARLSGMSKEDIRSLEGNSDGQGDASTIA